MKTIISILVSIILLAGCAVQPREITPEEKQRILKIFLEQQYLDYQLRKAEKEFGVEPNNIED
ncbi:hypothetical protein LCGC14_1589960 [marine sediment metagenome]|uniref:Lipoprotein n=1 Tax=marine sediment metagenome TaxID=412755 RepID=A0A0F9KUZ1_9ZZZZ